MRRLPVERRSLLRLPFAMSPFFGRRLERRTECPAHTGHTYAGSRSADLRTGSRSELPSRRYGILGNRESAGNQGTQATDAKLAPERGGEGIEQHGAGLGQSAQKDT